MSMRADRSLTQRGAELGGHDQLGKHAFCDFPNKLGRVDSNHRLPDPEFQGQFQPSQVSTSDTEIGRRAGRQ